MTTATAKRPSTRRLPATIPTRKDECEWANAGMGERRERVPLARYIEDIFMHVRSSSRSLAESLQIVSDLADQPRESPEYALISISSAQAAELLEHINHHAYVTGELLAAVAPAAVERARLLVQAFPEYTEGICDLTPVGVDDLIRPFFEAAGIAEDFMPADVRFPNFDAEEVER